MCLNEHWGAVFAVLSSSVNVEKKKAKTFAVLFSMFSTFLQNYFINYIFFLNSLNSESLLDLSELVSSFNS